MSERTVTVRWRVGVLSAGLLAIALVSGLGTQARSASGPLDAPVSAEPRVPVAKCLTFPGLQSSKGTNQPFARVEKGDTLYSRDVLVAVPGLKVEIEPDSKTVAMTLWGNLHGLSDSPVRESCVILHDSRAYDLDFTLVRGRVVLTNSRDKGPAKIWLRADTGVEMVLPEPGDSVALEIYGRWLPGVPFAMNTKNAPVRLWEVHCLKGRLEIKAAKTTWNMEAPPGPSYFHGDSVSGPAEGGPKFQPLPLWADPKAKAPPLAKMIQSVLDTYAGKLKSKDSEDVATELLANAEKDEDPDRAAVTRQLVISALAALDEIGAVAEMLNNSKHEDARKTAVVSLRHWIGAHEGRDEKVYERLQSGLGFTKNEAEAVMQMLHSPFSKDQPETYKTLIAYLKHRRQAVRELAYWHLYRLAPIGRKIPYDASAPAAERDKAADAWKKLVPSGELPKEAVDDTKDSSPPMKGKAPAKAKKAATRDKAPAKEKKVVEREKPATKAQPTEAKEAVLVVKVEASAMLTMDGEPTKQRRAQRRFLTPPLKPGIRYYYVVAAIWSPDSVKTITRTRKAYVKAGETKEVDLRHGGPRKSGHGCHKLIEERYVHDRRGFTADRRSCRRSASRRSGDYLRWHAGPACPAGLSCRHDRSDQRRADAAGIAGGSRRRGGSSPASAWGALAHQPRPAQPCVDGLPGKPFRPRHRLSPTTTEHRPRYRRPDARRIARPSSGPSAYRGVTFLLTADQVGRTLRPYLALPCSAPCLCSLPLRRGSAPLAQYLCDRHWRHL